MLLVKRVRGLAGTALTWAVGGAVAGLVAYFAGVNPWPADLSYFSSGTSQLAVWEAIMFVGGGVGGMVFSLLTLALERRRLLPELTLARVAAWGAMAGVSVPALLGIRTYIHFGANTNGRTLFSLIAASALLGAAWASAALAMARRRPSSPKQALFLQDMGMPLMSAAASTREHALDATRVHPNQNRT